MRSLCLSIILFAASCTATAAPAAQAPRAQVLFFDARFTQLRTAGPDANQVGHLQIASGLLRDARERSVGHFAFTCRWIESLPDDDALEHCSGRGQTADGRFSFAGSARANDPTHSWRLNGVDDAYRGASGTLVVRDLGDRESLALVAIRPRRGIALRIGRVPRPAANGAFLTRANAACTAAENEIAKLPPFPVQNFDPLHPDPGLLAQVGSFFSGPGDSRPALHALQRRLAALGRPPRNKQAWAHVLHRLAAKIAVFERQVRAAVAGDVPAWIRATEAADPAERRLLIADAVFGTTRCVF